MAADVANCRYGCDSGTAAKPAGTATRGAPAVVTNRHVDPRRDLRQTTNSGAMAVGLFLGLSWVTTQVEAIRVDVPFTEDPYDAIVSFAVIGIVVIGGTTIVRALGHMSRPMEVSVIRRIAIGAVLALAMAGIALVSDLVAIVTVGVEVGGPDVAAVQFLVGLAVVAAIAATAVAWRARGALVHPPGDPSLEPDILDELGALAGSVGAARSASRLLRWAEDSPFSPRRHRVAAGLIVGIAAGVGAVVWHAIREGAWASPAAAVLFGTLMAVGVIGAYLVCLGPLRLLRPVRGHEAVRTG